MSKSVLVWRNTSYSVKETDIKKKIRTKLNKRYYVSAKYYTNWSKISQIATLN